MSKPVRLTRDRFQTLLAGASIDVSKAKADVRLSGVDVESADLDKDGKIEGKKEIKALFGALDKVERDSSPKSILLNGSTAGEQMAERVTAVADLSKASRLKALARPGNDDVVFIGVRTENKVESDALAALGKYSVTRIGGDSETLKVGSEEYDLSTDEGLDAFTLSLGLPADQTEAIFRALKGTGRSARDEMAQLALIWAEAEKGGEIPSRLMISGHSIGSMYWGDNGLFTDDDLLALARAMPEAAEQIEDISINGCSTGGASISEVWLSAFPNLQTLWAYNHSAPGAGPGAIKDEKAWDKATRGRVDELERGTLAKKVTTAEELVVWSAEGGYDDGSKPRALEELRADVASAGAVFEDYFQGKKSIADAHRNDLRPYYDALKDLLDSPSLPPGERPALREERAHVLYTMYYADIADGFAKANSGLIDKGYAAVPALAKPDYAKLDRASGLAKIDEYLVATEGSKDADVLALREKLIALQELDADPAMIDPRWIR